MSIILLLILLIVNIKQLHHNILINLYNHMLMSDLVHLRYTFNMDIMIMDLNVTYIILINMVDK